MRRRIRTCAAVAVWLTAGIVVGTVVLLASVVARGGRVLVMASGSMAPTIRTGDVTVGTSITASQARVGQVITFRDPTRDNHLVSHRVRAVTVADGRARFVTKGDKNTAVEQWNVAADGRIGRVQWRIRAVGHAIAAVRGRRGQIAFVAVPAFLLGFTELIGLWRPRRVSTLTVELDPVAAADPAWDEILE